MVQKLLIFSSALFLTQSLWAQSAARLTVTDYSLNKNGMDISAASASKNERECFEAQARELEKAGMVSTAHFFTTINIYLFSEMSSGTNMVIQETPKNEVELGDELSPLSNSGTSLTVTLSEDGICKVTSAELLSEIFKNYLY